MVINFDHYFPADEDLRHGNLWIKDPFIQDINSCNLDAHTKEILIELSCDSALQSRFKKESLTTFLDFPGRRIFLTKFYSFEIISSVFDKLLVCEILFSIDINQNKTKQRNRLDAESQQRISETSLTPRFSLFSFLFPSQGSCVAEPEATFPISAKPRTLRSLIRLSPPPSSPLNFLRLPQISVGLLPVAQTKLPIAC